MSVSVSLYMSVSVHVCLIVSMCLCLSVLYTGVMKLLILYILGKTQVPSGSITVLALFGKGYHIDEVTGQLSLL